MIVTREIEFLKVPNFLLNGGKKKKKKSKNIIYLSR